MMNLAVKDKSSSVRSVYKLHPKIQKQIDAAPYDERCRPSLKTRLALWMHVALKGHEYMLLFDKPYKVILRNAYGDPVPYARRNTHKIGSGCGTCGDVWWLTPTYSQMGIPFDSQSIEGGHDISG